MRADLVAFMQVRVAPGSVAASQQPKGTPRAAASASRLPLGFEGETEVSATDCPDHYPDQHDYEDETEVSAMDCRRLRLATIECRSSPSHAADRRR